MELNKTEIRWAVVRPASGKGIVTKADIVRLEGYDRGEGGAPRVAVMRRMSEGVEEFRARLATARRLSKPLRVTMMTDLQFGEWDQRDEPPFTAKQVAESFVVGA